MNLLSSIGSSCNLNSYSPATKKFLLCVPFALMLGGCVELEEVIEPGSNDIGYDVAASKVTRVADSYSTLVLPASIEVWARTVDNIDYIPGDIISRDKNGKWVDQTTTRVWPTGKTLNFAANVNSGGTFKYDADGIPSFENFSVNDSPAGQKDLMYAVSMGASNTGGNVKLNFRHALSQVCFDAQNNTTNIDIKVKSVGITHVTNKGTYKFPTKSTTIDGVSQDGKDITPKGEWELADDYTHSYSVSLGDTGIDLAPAAVAANGERVSLTTPGGEIGNSGVMALLPQTVAAWNPEIKGTTFNGACFILDVVMNDVSGDDPTLIYEGKVAIPVNINWNEGCKYIYNLKFSQGGNGGMVADPENPVPVLATIGYDVSVSDFTIMSTDTNVDSGNDEPGNEDPENPADEDPRNPLSKFSVSNLGSSSATRSSDGSFLFYQWGRNQGYKDWQDALGEAVFDESRYQSLDGFVAYNPDSNNYVSILSGSGGFQGTNQWFDNVPKNISNKQELQENTDKFVMNAFPSEWDTYTDYWAYTAFGYETGEIVWGGRAKACGYTETDPCPEGWRLPTEADFREIFPNESTTYDNGESELTFSSPKEEKRQSGDINYAIRWEMNGDGLLVKCLVLDSPTTEPDWTSKDVVTRTFPFTGAIVPMTGTYVSYRYATPYHMAKNVNAFEDSGHFRIDEGVDTGKTFGGYWVSDAKKAFSFSNPTDGGGYLRIAEDHPAYAYAIRPVKK